MKFNKSDFIKAKKALKASNPELTNQEMNAQLRDQIFGNSPKASAPRLNSKDTLAAIRNITSIDDLNTLSINEDRATVLAAIEKRIKTLSNN
jgi:hypothetical protein